MANRINNMINGIIQVYHLIKIISMLLIMMDQWKMKIGTQKALKVNLIISHNVRNVLSSFLKIRQSIKDNGKETYVMDTEFKSGQMEQSMKGIGKIIKHMVKVFSGMSMEINMRENGREIKHMDMANIHIVMEQLTKVTGVMIYNMDRE